MFNPVWGRAVIYFKGDTLCSRIAEATILITNVIKMTHSFTSWSCDNFQSAGLDSINCQHVRIDLTNTLSKPLKDKHWSGIICNAFLRLIQVLSKFT